MMTKTTAGKPPARRAAIPAPKPAAKRSAAAKAAAPTESTLVHPRSVATIPPPNDSEDAPEQVFAEGPQDEIDPDLRYRMISEIAYHRYVERGYADGGDIDDWLQAEAEVDHLIANRGRGADNGG